MTTKDARLIVAAQWRENARKIREADEYADHVTEAQKAANLERALAFADEIESGIHDGNFTIAQRIHFAKTGESPALLP